MPELNKEQKELLAVIRYANQQVANGNVRKLIIRLYEIQRLSYQEIADTTGYSFEVVRRILSRPINTKKRKIGTERIAEKWANDPVVLNVGETIIFDETTVSGRVAKEVYEKWIGPCGPGSPIPNSRTMMEEFQVTKSTTSEVFGILRAKGLVVEKTKGNPRQGYVTK